MHNLWTLNKYPWQGIVLTPLLEVKFQHIGLYAIHDERESWQEEHGDSIVYNMVYKPTN